MFKPITLEAHNPGPMTGSGNLTYLLDAGEGRAVLVDAGVADPRHLEAIVGHLRAHRAVLDQVLVTHAHGDHASGAASLASAHRDVRFYKIPWPERDVRYPVPWRPIEDGDSFSMADGRLVAVHTPGHSPDHLAFWHERSRTMFTGDLVVPGGSVMIEASSGGDMTQYLASLERVLALKPERLLPAHGAEVNEPAQLLRGYIEHRQMRERQVLQAMAAGRHTVSSIVDSIYHGLVPALLPAACENVQAHLDKLAREGRAFDDQGHWRLKS